MRACGVQPWSRRVTDDELPAAIEEFVRDEAGREGTSVVIGPQGVCEAADVTGTHEQDWLDYEASGEPVAFRVVIFFPWDPEKKLFAGERVFVAPHSSPLPLPIRRV